VLSIPSISLVNTTNHQKNNIINFSSSLHISHQTTQISLQTPPATTTTTTTTITTTTKPLYSSTPLHLTMPPHPNPNPPPQTHPSATAILTTKTISITHSPLNPPTPTPKNPHTARLDSINKLRSEWAQDPRKSETWYARDCERQYLENLAAMNQLFAEDKQACRKSPRVMETPEDMDERRKQIEEQMAQSRAGVVKGSCNDIDENEAGR